MLRPVQILRTILLIAAQVFLFYFSALSQTRSSTPADLHLIINSENGSFYWNQQADKLRHSEFMDALRTGFNLGQDYEFLQIRSYTDESGATHSNYQLQFRNHKLEDGIVMIHEKEGVVYYASGLIVHCDSGPIQPGITANEAAEAVTKHFNLKQNAQQSAYELVFLPEQNITRLVYKIRLESTDPFLACDVYVDANTSRIIRKIDLVNTEDVPGSAQTFNSGSQNVLTENYNGSFRLRSATRRIETYNVVAATMILDYDMNVDSQVEYTNSTENWGNTLRVSELKIAAVSNHWWQSPSDMLPELFITVENANGVEIYHSHFFPDDAPEIIFNRINYFLWDEGPYTIKIWDFQDNESVNFGGAFTIDQTPGTHAWSVNGNSGTYTVTSSGNPALDVHWGAERSIDFFRNKFNRNGYDGNNGLVKQMVGLRFYGFRENAVAYSNLGLLAYGLGNSLDYKPFVNLSVVGHEFTHLVIGHNGNGGLYYSGESGALNESFADIFGVSIDFESGSQPNWLIGEETRYNGLAIRDMSNPNSRNHPDTYQGAHWIVPETDQFDNGGVHTNSGVQDYWYYLLVMGGSGTNDLGTSYAVQGIGPEKSLQIAYRNLMTYLPPGATYKQACQGSVQAAADLFGYSSTEYQSVINAWVAVGVLYEDLPKCSGSEALTDFQGSMSDNSGNFDYGRNSECEWIISVPTARSIELEFNEFDTENDNDYVIVYDGVSVDSPVLFQHSGADLPPAVKTSDYNSSGNSDMRIVFHTNNTINGKGWNASYKAVFDQLTCYPNPSSGIVTFYSNEQNRIKSIQLFDCTGRLVVETGSLDAPEVTYSFDQLSAGQFIAQIKTATGIVRMPLHIN